ncbi:PucR family transcriptional regulator [Alkaliphilus peptidifermentans]|uniref:Transcriptional regulator, CdaR family n=1 Tax=Alkaliphilus peptidifermentans DSM 18978 TaxID=1120976 RepID=A0A1G5KWQ1_9FIRM|nr:PucR family transcriptional regulator [Alkaliphilus peptidifermentans]SCZ04571.1 transcriptional regulator, CdaR family [Alkaliphilus peptidifermentans DSM 18978]
MIRQNGITIDEAIKLKSMKNCKLIAGHRGIYNTISKVNITADPDFVDWVDAGELLMTTAYSFKNEKLQVQKDLITECSRKGLAGIGIKIYPYLDALPEEIINLANELNFPIIDIYHETPLSDIMTSIFKEIFNKQASLLQRIETVHEQLMNVVLSGGDIHDIVRVVYENLQNPILVKIEYTNQAFMGLEELAEDTRIGLLNNYRRFYDGIENKIREKKFNETVELINGKHVRRMVMPIIVKNNVYGHIFSWALKTPLGGFDLSVLETASTTIALEVLKQLSVRDVENRHRSEFMEDLLSLDLNRKSKAIEKAPVFKLLMDQQFKMIVVQIENQKDKMADDLLQKIALLNHDAEGLVEELNLKAFIVSKTDSLYILFSFSKELDNDHIIKTFCDHLEKYLCRRLKDGDYKIGIGRSYNGLSDVYKSYIDAVKAISSGDLIGNNNVVYFEQLGIYKILCQDYLREELEKFYDVTISSLVEYDQKKSTELVKTLEVYFTNNGNLKKLSEELYTHYNTTLYRIQRIQSITGMSLDNHKDRLNLEMALKIKKLLKK